MLSLGQTSPAAWPDLALFTAGYVNAIAVQPDGKIVVGGAFKSINGIARTNLARLNPDGSVDPDWAPHADGVVYALAASPEAVFVGGTFTRIGGVERNGLAKIDLEGPTQIDPFWNPAAAEPGTTIQCMTEKGGLLYVAGQFRQIGDHFRRGLARLYTSSVGEADRLWNPEPDGNVNDIVVDGDYIYVGGDFANIGRLERNYLAKLEGLYGMADPEWDPKPDGTVSALAVSSGHVYVGGGFSQIGLQPRPHLARLSKEISGLADPEWDPQPDGRVLGLAVAGDDLIAIGRFSQIGARSRHGIARLSQLGNGLADPRWNAYMDASLLDPVHTVVPSAAGWYVGGSFKTVDESVALALAQLDPATGRLTSAFSAHVQRPGEVKAMVRQPGGELVIGGDFYLVNGLPRQNLARLRADQSVDPAWNPQVNGPVFALASSQTEVFVGGSFTKAGGFGVTNLARFHLASPGMLDWAWIPNPEGGYVVHSIALGSDGLYVGGAFTRIGGQPRRNIAKLSTSWPATADPRWAPDSSSAAGGDVQALLLAEDHLYVAGAFEALGGHNRKGLARLDARGAGTADPLWDPNLSNPAAALALGHGYLYASSGRQLLRVSTAGIGEADLTWQAQTDDAIRSVAVAGTKVYAGGNFTTVDGLPRKFIARFDAQGNGRADPFWDRPIDDPYAPVVALLPDAHGIYAGGSFTAIAGQPRMALALLSEPGAPVIVVQGTRVIIQPHPDDGLEVTHFRIQILEGGPLYRSDEVTPVAAGEFVSREEGQEGLRSRQPVRLAVVAALNDTPAGAGAAASVVELGPVPEPPPIRLSGPELLGDGTVRLTLEGGTNRVYSIVASPDLAQPLASWTEILRITNTTAVAIFPIARPSEGEQVFYAARED